MTIKEILREAIKTHIAHNNGLVTAPEKLLDLQIQGLVRWLTHEQQTYEEAENWDAHLAIQDIVRNQLE